MDNYLLSIIGNSSAGNANNTATKANNTAGNSTAGKTYAAANTYSTAQKVSNSIATIQGSNPGILSKMPKVTTSANTTAKTGNSSATISKGMIGGVGGNFLNTMFTPATNSYSSNSYAMPSFYQGNASANTSANSGFQSMAKMGNTAPNAMPYYGTYQGQMGGMGTSYVGASPYGSMAGSMGMGGMGMGMSSPYGSMAGSMGMGGMSMGMSSPYGSMAGSMGMGGMGMGMSSPYGSMAGSMGGNGMTFAASSPYGSISGTMNSQSGMGNMLGGLLGSMMGTQQGQQGQESQVPAGGYGEAMESGLSEMGMAGMIMMEMEKPVTGGKLEQEAGEEIKYTTSGGYKVDIKGTTVSVTDQSGENVVTQWGDPHERFNGEEIKQWQGNTRTLVLDDGTKITMNADKYNGDIHETSIYDGSQAINIDNDKTEVTSVEFDEEKSKLQEQNQADGETSYVGLNDEGKFVYETFYTQNSDLSISENHKLLASSEKTYWQNKPSEDELPSIFDSSQPTGQNGSKSTGSMLGDLMLNLFDGGDETEPSNDISNFNPYQFMGGKSSKSGSPTGKSSGVAPASQNNGPESMIPYLNNLGNVGTSPMLNSSLGPDSSTGGALMQIMQIFASLISMMQGQMGYNQ